MNMPRLVFPVVVVYIIVAASLLFSGASSGDVDDGMAAWRAGRFDVAFKSYSAAERDTSATASTDLLKSLAMSALRADRPREAEIAVEKTVVRGGDEFEPWRDFMLGHIAFARCEKAEFLSRRVEAGIPAFDAAIAQAKSARDAWRRAAIRRTDWPAARRNIERVQAKLSELARRREEALERARKASQKKQQPPPTPESNEGNDEKNLEKPQSEPPAAVVVQTTELSPDQVRRLTEKLAEKEAEKRAVRRTARQARSAGGRDW